MKTNRWQQLLLSDAAESLSEIGLFLMAARKRRGLSVVDLADRAGVDRRTISQLESGHPGVSLGLFFQVLSLLRLLPGIEEFLKPENDIEAATAIVRKIRKKQRQVKAIPPEEVDF